MAGIHREREHLQISDGKARIPEISDERLRELSQRIKPVLRYARGERGLFLSGNGLLFYIKDVDPKKVSFIWGAKPTRRAAGLKELSRIETYHTYGYYGLFKPSIAEVIAQIPEGDLDEVVAFETLTDLGQENILHDEGLHITTTILYRENRIHHRRPSNGA